jgi:Zn-dependent M32 family carboxypeptidase
MEDLLDSGESLISISERFGVSKFALSRHLRHNKPAPPPDSLESRVVTARLRADELWHQAKSNADSRGMAQALSASVRQLELEISQAKEQAESAPAAASDSEFTLDEIDRFVAKFDKMHEELEVQKCAEAAQNCRRLDQPNAMACFFAMEQDPRLRALVEQTVTGYLNQKEEANGKKLTRIEA